VRRHIAQQVGFEENARRDQTTHLVEERALDKFGNAMLQTSRACGGRHLRSVTLTGSLLKDLAAVCILTRPFRLQGHELNQTMHVYIVSKRDVSMAAMINLGAQSCLHVSLILLRSTQLSGTCGEIPLRGS
jgi:hypothetical protein